VHRQRSTYFSSFEATTSLTQGVCGSWAGDIFKCKLIPLQQALQRGMYGSIDMHQHIGQLNKIFPEGVCDYQQGDIDRPAKI
jgi:hypothetical protein